MVTEANDAYSKAANAVKQAADQARTITASITTWFVIVSLLQQFLPGTPASSAAATATRSSLSKENFMSTILLILILLALVGALPSWGYSRDWGYGPSGVLGIVLLLLILMALAPGGVPLR